MATVPELVTEVNALKATSVEQGNRITTLTGVITKVSSETDILKDRIKALEDAAGTGNLEALTQAIADLKETQGNISTALSGAESAAAAADAKVDDV